MLFKQNASTLLNNKNLFFILTALIIKANKTDAHTTEIGV
jgi:hypothetical protein